MDDDTKARAAARRAARLAPARQHGAKDAVLQHELVVERGQCVNAGEPHQRVAEHAESIKTLASTGDMRALPKALGAHSTIEESATEDYMHVSCHCP